MNIEELHNHVAPLVAMIRDAAELSVNATEGTARAARIRVDNAVFALRVALDRFAPPATTATEHPFKVGDAVRPRTNSLAQHNPWTFGAARVESVGTVNGVPVVGVSNARAFGCGILASVFEPAMDAGADADRETLGPVAGPELLAIPGP